MKVKYIDALNSVKEKLLKDKTIKDTIKKLKVKIQGLEDPFIWYVVDIGPFKRVLPSTIKSIWIFALKKDTPSIAHYHPNSVQHTVVIEGKGKIKIGDRWKDLKPFHWYIIDKKVTHEFFPKEENIVVISFHSCSAKELVELKSKSGEKRIYEK